MNTWGRMQSDLGCLSATEPSRPSRYSVKASPGSKSLPAIHCFGGEFDSVGPQEAAIGLDRSAHQYVSMLSHSSGRFRVSLTLLLGGIVILLVFGSVSGAMASTGQTPASSPSHLSPLAGSFQITGFSFAPSQAMSGNDIQGMVTLSGGVAPFYLWFNDTAPGCGPSSNPVMLSGPSLQFNCTPTSTGSYSVHLDALDSASPPDKATQTAPLTVTSNSNGNGNGNGNGNSGSNGSNGSSSGNNNGGFSIPSSLITMLMLFGIVLLGSIVALAAGVIAVAVLVSRRLRQLTETMAKANNPSSPAKPPK